MGRAYVWTLCLAILTIMREYKSEMDCILYMISYPLQKLSDPSTVISRTILNSSRVLFPSIFRPFSFARCNKQIKQKLVLISARAFSGYTVSSSRITSVNCFGFCSILVYISTCPKQERTSGISSLAHKLSLSFLTSTFFAVLA